MAVLPIAGPSYQLRNRRADAERCINWIPVQIESGAGKGGAGSYLKQAPGKVRLTDLGAEVRGLWVTRGVLYAVAGSTLYRIGSDWTATSLGTLSSSTGPVSMVDNNTQLMISGGADGYVYDLDAGTLAAQGGNWRGSVRVDALDGYGVFADPASYQLYTSGPQDFGSLDALDFGSAESSPGPIVAHLVKHREVLVLKQRTGEVWYDAGNADGIPLAPNTGAALEVGCLAAHSLQKMAGVALWLGRDDRGAAVVFAMQAYVPQRVSTHALEELLGGLTEAQLSGARAWCYHQEGLSYYVLQVPGLETTWVYELAAGVWHERAEFAAGMLSQDAGVCHAYAYGVHVVGSLAGRLYRLDPTVNTNDGAVLLRERTTPHNSAPGMQWQRYGSARIECNVGAGLAGADGQLMLQYSNDGGMTWSGWRGLSLGQIGEYRTRVRATQLGASRDRVWRIRVTDDVRCEPISMLIDEV